MGLIQLLVYIGHYLIELFPPYRYIFMFDCVVFTNGYFILYES